MGDMQRPDIRKIVALEAQAELLVAENKGRFFWQNAGGQGLPPVGLEREQLVSPLAQALPAGLEVVVKTGRDLAEGPLGGSRVEGADIDQMHLPGPERFGAAENFRDVEPRLEVVEHHDEVVLSGGSQHVALALPVVTPEYLLVSIGRHRSLPGVAENGPHVKAKAAAMQATIFAPAQCEALDLLAQRRYLSKHSQPRESAMWQNLTVKVAERHSLLDRQVELWIAAYRQRGGAVHCARGCRGCCNLSVNATFSEALAIADSLGEPQRQRLQSHAARFIELTRDAADLKTYLKRHRDEVGFCPFLGEDGACEIYALRPFSCRALLATRPADWCAADFGQLSDLDRQLFMASLDRSAVAFPTHYVAETQELARGLEEQSSLEMLSSLGVSLYGNLPLLVYLQTRYRLSEVLEKGYRATADLLAQQGLDLPFAIVLDQ